MVGPDVTPEDGLARYEYDRTQGHACATAASAVTIYRNYFGAVGERAGQTAERQFDGLADIGAELNPALDRCAGDLWLWTMRNGYALCKREGLDLIAEHLRAIGPDQTGALAGKPRIGVSGRRSDRRADHAGPDRLPS
ncbi:hypothetical protein WKW80_34825 [Variovorax humicola]|uniref:Uncharacterized protein n=1 Tax=Variovorax humicola TaxID=1769758 RepID=A0ABU8WCM1_9BURK